MLTTLPPSCVVVMKSGNLNFLQPVGHSRPVTGLLYLFTLSLISRSLSPSLAKIGFTSSSHLSSRLSLLHVLSGSRSSFLPFVAA